MKGTNPRPAKKARTLLDFFQPQRPDWRHPLANTPDEEDVSDQAITAAEEDSARMRPRTDRDVEEVPPWLSEAYEAPGSPALLPDAPKPSKLKGKQPATDDVQLEDPTPSIDHTQTGRLPLPIRGYGPRPLTKDQIANLAPHVQNVVGDDGFIDESKLEEEPKGGVKCETCNHKFRSWRHALAHAVENFPFERKEVYKEAGYKNLEAAKAAKAHVCCLKLKACAFTLCMGEHVQCTREWDKIKPGNNEARGVVKYDIYLHQDSVRDDLGPLPHGLPCRCGLIWPNLQFLAAHIYTKQLGPRCPGTALTSIGRMNFTANSIITISEGVRYHFETSEQLRSAFRQDAMQQQQPTGEALDDVQAGSGFHDRRAGISGVNNMSNLIPKAEQEFFDILATVPKTGELVILPWRKSPPSTAKTTVKLLRDMLDDMDTTSRHWLQLHAKVFKSTANTFRFNFICSSIYFPIMYGEDEYRRLVTAYGDQDRLHMWVQTKHAMVMMDLALQMLLARPPKDRVIVTIADSFSCCQGLLAMFCAKCEFKLRIGLTRTEVEEVNPKDSDDEEDEEDEEDEKEKKGKKEKKEKKDEKLARSGFVRAINAKDERYRGFAEERHWFELHSPLIAEVYARVKTDDLVETYLRWCKQKQRGKDGQTRGRGKKVANETPMRKAMRNVTNGIKRRLKAKLEGEME